MGRGVWDGARTPMPSFFKPWRFAAAFQGARAVWSRQYMTKVVNRNQFLAKLLRHIDRLHLRDALRGPSEENVYVTP